MPVPANPFAGNAAVSGPSPDFFPLTAAMNDTLPVNTASATPALPKTVRAVRCLVDGTISLQSLGGGVISWPAKAGDVHDTGYVVAVSGVANSTSFAGYV